MRKRFCDAQISAAYTGKRHLDAEVSLSALKYAAMETERAVVLGYLSKCGALLEELEAQKLQTAVIRRQVVDLRQELSGVRRQLVPPSARSNRNAGRRIGHFFYAQTPPRGLDEHDE